MPADVAASPARVPALRWPLPALLAWVAAWGANFALTAAGASPPLAAAAGVLVPVAFFPTAAGLWRRCWLLAGFPASALVLGAGGVPAWVWLLPLAALLVVYPLRTWRDAPIFPTPRDALAELPPLLGLPARAKVHDAGCGLGDGLAALHAAWPDADLSGVEHSAPLAWVARRRCRYARIRRGDMWAVPWTGLDLVYLFQRPESMERAWRKAAAEMAAGGWLVSLEFAVPGVAPRFTARTPGGRTLWVYRTGGSLPPDSPQPRRRRADKPV
jgi:hypothetical protein